MFVGTSCILALAGDDRKGETVEKVNRIRKQLDANPLNQILGNGTLYGQRNTYGGLEVNKEDAKDGKMDLVTLIVSFTVGKTTNTISSTSKRRKPSKKN